MSTIRDCISRDLFFLTKEDGIDVAVKIMDKMEIEHVPIVEGSKPVGILSRRGLDHWKSRFENSSFDTSPDFPEKVSEVMCTDLLKIDIDESLSDCISLMLLKNSHCVLIVNKKGNLKGVITSTDILKSYLMTLD